MPSSSPPLTVSVVTPEQSLVETEADFVVVPLFDGELGIARGHCPMIGRLGYGELRLKMGEETARYFVEGGFVQVDRDAVSVMTQRAMKVERIDVQQATDQLAEALKKSASGEEALSRQREIDQARGKLRVARANS